MLFKKTNIILMCLLVHTSTYSQEANLPKEAIEVDIPSSSLEELSQDRPQSITWKDVRKLQDMTLMFQVSNLESKDKMILANQAMGTARQRLFRQIRGFAPEALVFYTAIGGAMARKAYTDNIMSGRRDPAWMENLLHEMTSPIGVFSFFCFLIASGQSNYWISQSLKPWSQKLAAQKKSLDTQLIQDKKRVKNQAKRNKKIKHIKNTSFLQPAHVISQTKVNSSKWNSYRASQIGFRQTAALINQVGMAAGILASNIVTEISVLIDNPAIHYCANHLLPSKLSDEDKKLSEANGDLICEDAFMQSMVTFKSWGPDILSVVVAAFINHGLMQGLVSIKNGGVLTLRFLKKVTIRSKLSFTKLLSKLAWFVPGPGTVSKAITVAGHWTFRLFSLYSFMEISEMVGHHWFHSWNDSLYASNLSDSMLNFSQNFKTDQLEKKGLNCESSSDKQNCTYHTLIKQAVNTANDFKRWRQFQSTPVEMARQNWFFYVSNATAYFDLAYTFYKTLLSSSNANNPLNQTHYFGSLFSPSFSKQGILSKSQTEIPKEASLAFKNMQQIIARYAHQNNISLENISHVPFIVSSSTESSFLKPNIQLQKIGWQSPIPVWSAKMIVLDSPQKQLLVLYNLFSVVNESNSISRFYPNWSEELLLAKDRALKEHSKHLATTCNQAVRFIKSAKEIQEIKQSDPDIFAQMLSDYNYSEASLNQHLKTQKQVVSQCVQEKIKWFHLDRTSQDILEEASDNFISYEEAKSLVQKYYKQNPTQWEKDAKFILRKHILAAGSELLNKIILTSTNQHPVIKSMIQWITPSSKKEEEQIRQWQNQQVSESLITAAKALGPSHIWIQLFKELHLSTSNSNMHPSSIAPFARGRLMVQNINQYYAIKKEYFKVQYHPDQLGKFNTPGIVDYLVVSALCGPILNKSTKHQDMLDKIKQITREEQIEQVFPGADMNDILQEIPIFKKSFTGGFFYLQPPKIIGLSKNKKAIQNLCNSPTAFSSEIAFFSNIYQTNQAFTVHGKNYHSLLQFASEYTDSKLFPSSEAFDTWWKQQVEPYYHLYILLANREYLKMTRTWLMPLLFQNKETEVPITMNNILKQYKQTEDGSHPTFIAKGLFQNIHQEIDYWLEIIKTLTKDSDNYMEAEEHLHQMHELFKLPLYHWESVPVNSWSEEILNFLLTTPKQMTYTSKRQYTNWIQEFLREQRDTSYLNQSIYQCSLTEEEQKLFKELNKLQQAYLHLHLSACLLNVDMVTMTEKLHATEVALNSKSHIHESEFTTAQDHQIGFFYEEKNQTVKKQILNYIFITLKNLLLETSSYMDILETISENPDIKEVSVMPNMQ